MLHHSTPPSSTLHTQPYQTNFTSHIPRPGAPHPYSTSPSDPSKPVSAEGRFKQIYGADTWTGLQNRSFIVSLLSADDDGTDTEDTTDHRQATGKKSEEDVQKIQVTTTFRVVPPSETVHMEMAEEGEEEGENGIAKEGDYELLLQVIIPPKDGKGDWMVRSYAAYISGQIPTSPSTTHIEHSQILACTLQQLPKCLERYGISLEVYPADVGEGHFETLLVRHADPNTQDSALPLVFEAVPAPVKEAFLSIDFFEHTAKERLDKLWSAHIEEEEKRNAAAGQATKQKDNDQWQKIKRLGESLDHKIKLQQETRMAFKRKLAEYAREQRKQQEARIKRGNPARPPQVA